MVLFLMNNSFILKFNMINIKESFFAFSILFKNIRGPKTEEFVDCLCIESLSPQKFSFKR